MSVANEVLSWLRVLAWPAVVCILVLAFRTTIRSVLRVRLTKVEAAGISASFESTVKDNERIAAAAKTRQPPAISRVNVPSQGLSDTPGRYFRPRQYEEARAMAEEYRAGSNLVLDLTGTRDAVAMRFVDFAAGLIFASYGSIQRVGDRTFLLDHDHPEPPPPARVPAAAP
jgi:hypothetical protein